MDSASELGREFNIAQIINQGWTWPTERNILPTRKHSLNAFSELYPGRTMELVEASHLTCITVQNVTYTINQGS